MHSYEKCRVCETACRITLVGKTQKLNISNVVTTDNAFQDKISQDYLHLHDWHMSELHLCKEYVLSDVCSRLYISGQIVDGNKIDGLGQGCVL